MGLRFLLSISFGGFMLGASLLSGCLPIVSNVATDQRDLALKAEAKTYMGTMMRAQQAHYLEKQAFAATLEDLALGIPAETDQYTIAIAEVGDTQVLMTALAKSDQLPSYGAGVFSDPTSPDLALPITLLCESTAPTASPPVPQLEGSTPVCPADTQPVE